MVHCRVHHCTADTCSTQPAESGQAEAWVSGPCLRSRELGRLGEQEPGESRQSWYHIRSLRAAAGAADDMANTRLGGAGLQALRPQKCTCCSVLRYIGDDG